jgi:hypothetical protein
LDLQNICSKYNNARAEIWFLQPDDCLESDTFGFVRRQASKFSPAKITNGKSKFQSSNDLQFWDEAARKVVQRIAIANPIYGMN